ncbi:MAG: NAD+ synthase, partial [Betaproteobacteria bacterium]|nr:NAD+ synthase [Betaproteobacteria bacterium]
MKIAIAQLNVIVGDLAGNAEKIMAAAQRARADGASLLVTTELALCGYPPEDLLLRDSFFRACDEEFQRLVSAVSGITLVLGHPHQIGIKRYNAASVIRDGKVVATYLKRTLP